MQQKWRSFGGLTKGIHKPLAKDFEVFCNISKSQEDKNDRMVLAKTR
jgi:hypothetical protein